VSTKLLNIGIIFVLHNYLSLYIVFFNCYYSNFNIRELKKDINIYKTKKNKNIYLFSEKIKGGHDRFEFTIYHDRPATPDVQHTLHRSNILVTP
jgi:hypothetical protein